MERVGTTWASLRKENLIFDLLILNQIDEVDYGTTALIIGYEAYPRWDGT